MIMKKHILITGIAISLTLIACSDKLTGAKQAEAVEARYRAIAQATDNMMKLTEQSNAFIHPSYSVISYQRGEQSSTAQSQLKLQPTGEDAKSAIVLQINDQINHDDKLRKDKILAKITSTLSLAPETINSLNLDQEAKEKIATALKHVKLETELLDDNKVAQNLEIIPFDIKDDEYNIHYDGLTTHFDGIQPDGKTVLQEGKAKITSGKFTFTDPRNAITISPFNINIDSKKDAVITLKADTIKLESTGSQNFTFSIGQTEFTGSDLNYDKTSGQLLGKQMLTLTDATSTHNTPIAVGFSQIQVSSEVKKNGDNYDYYADTSLSPTSNTNNLIKQLTHLPTPSIDKVHFDISANGISLKTYKAFTTLSDAYYFYSNKKFGNLTNIDEATIQAGLNDLLVNKNEMNANLLINTEAGKAEAKFQLLPLETATTINNGNPEDLFKQLLSNYFIKLDITIDRKIIDATGMQTIFEGTVGPYVNKDEHNYTTHIEIIDGKSITINGIAIPI